MKEYELKPENGKSFFVGEEENDSSIELDAVRGYILLLKKTCYEEGFKAGYESAKNELSKNQDGSGDEE